MIQRTEDRLMSVKRLIDLVRQTDCYIPCDLPDGDVSLDDLEVSHPEWLLVTVGYLDEAVSIIGIDRLRRCAERAPEAVFYWGAWERLPRDIVDMCAQRVPDLALTFACNILTDEQVDLCAQSAPKEAIICAYDRITPERLDRCAVEDPETAMREISKIGDLLTPTRVRWLMSVTHYGDVARWLALRGFVRGA